MILAMLRVMALSVIRDRGALALAFLLPPIIFIIFATIFSGSSGEEMRLHVAYGSGINTASIERLERALRDDASLRVLPGISSSRPDVANLVQAGRADVGLFVAGDPDDANASPIIILVDPAKMIAGASLAGQVQSLIAQKVPEIGLSRTAPHVGELVGGFTPQQDEQLRAALQEIAANGEITNAPALVAMETIGSATSAGATISYYAGAVAILFLLFSAMQGAATLIEERHSGIVDRVAVGPAGTDVVVLGKFFFLTGQGMLQVGLIFIVAAIVYGVDVTHHLGEWALTTLVASAATAGLGLAVASACTSKQQAQTVSTFVVLVSSAIGGSMVPRFMMPPWLQDVGWFSPNAWAIEAYHGILWRGETLGEIASELAWLLSIAMIGVILALIISRLRLRL